MYIRIYDGLIKAKFRYIYFWTECNIAFKRMLYIMYLQFRTKYNVVSSKMGQKHFLFYWE